MIGMSSAHTLRAATTLSLALTIAFVSTSAAGAPAPATGIQGSAPAGVARLEQDDSDIHAAAAAAAAGSVIADGFEPAAPLALALRPQRPAVPMVQTIAPMAPRHATQIVVAPTYSGTNHMWMPALGINRQVYSFPCTRSTAPDNLVYRWGCVGRNNVYLLGHAWGVFKPLHDAYVQGRLRIGMEVIYADGAGRIRHYRITSWRVVLPTDSSWFGDMAVPTMVLQTCIGATSTYRLNVKLVAVP